MKFHKNKKSYIQFKFLLQKRRMLTLNWMLLITYTNFYMHQFCINNYNMVGAVSFARNIFSKIFFRLVKYYKLFYTIMYIIHL